MATHFLENLEKSMILRQPSLLLTPAWWLLFPGCRQPETQRGRKVSGIPVLEEDSSYSHFSLLACSTEHKSGSEYLNMHPFFSLQLCYVALSPDILFFFFRIGCLHHDWMFIQNLVEIFLKSSQICQPVNVFKKMYKGWCCNLVVELLPSMSKAPG
jgi:hypothetical protein